MPGIIGGALLAFIISMDDLVITYFIAGVDAHDAAALHLRHAAARHQAGDQRHRDADAAVLAASSRRSASISARAADDRTAARIEPRARDLGLPFPGKPGPLNAITDVPGVARRLHHALIEDEPALATASARCAPASPPSCRAGSSRAPRPVWAGHSSLQRQRRDDRHALDPATAATSSARSCITNTHSVGIAHHAAIELDDRPLCRRLDEPTISG